LHQAKGLDAGPAGARMDILQGEVRLDFRRHAVLDLDRQEIRSGDALIAIL
jgi:hypothetical protein